MDDEPGGTADEGADRPVEEASPAAEIIALGWDDDRPVAPASQTEVAVDRAAPVGAVPDEADATDETEVTDDTDEVDGGEETDDTDDTDDTEVADDTDEADDGEDLGELHDDDHVAGRRNALPRRIESWRSRSASGAIATAVAMGLQQVFEPERRRPAAVAEAPSDPYSDDDPITVDYVPDDAEATTVHVKPWLLQKGDPT